MTGALDGDTLLVTRDASTTLVTRLSRGGVARNYLLRQFLAQDDFGWRYDALKPRSEYAVTVAEAQKLVRDVTGPNTNELRTVPASYIFVVTAANDSVKEGTLFGEKTWNASAKFWVAVAKLGYRTPEQVASSLGQFWCSPGCADRDTKRARFDSYAPPVDFLTSFTVSASATTIGQEGQDAAWAAVAVNMLAELIEETASRVAAFAVQGRIIALQPPAARIGRKEGVKPGARYFVMTSRESNGSVVQSRGAMLLAADVADNRQTAFVRGAVNAQVAAVDSTTFRQAFPGAIQRGDNIVERPSAISWFLGVVKAEELTGLFLEGRDEGLFNLPVGHKALLSLKYFRYSAGLYPGYTRGYDLLTGAIGYGYEFMPLAGRLRIMPLVMVGAATTKRDSTDDAQAKSFTTVEGGVDAGIRLTPEVELTGSVRRLRIGTIDPWTETVNPRFVRSINVGVRLQRGRWGF